jgi:hypothetical protein
MILNSWIQKFKIESMTLWLSIDHDSDWDFWSVISDCQLRFISLNTNLRFWSTGHPQRSPQNHGRKSRMSVLRSTSHVRTSAAKTRRQGFGRGDRGMSVGMYHVRWTIAGWTIAGWTIVGWTIVGWTIVGCVMIIVGWVPLHWHSFRHLHRLVHPSLPCCLRDLLNQIPFC